VVRRTLSAMSGKLDKPKPLDYLVMIGGPILFMAIAWWGLHTLAGGGTSETPFERLRNGAIHPGMTQEEVVRAVGPPKAEVQRETGGASYRYMRSTWDTQRATFLEEDAYVDFDRDGRVSGINFEAKTPDPPK